MGQPASLELVCCTTKRAKSSAKNSPTKARAQKHPIALQTTHEESDTHSDGSESGDGSDDDGLQALRAVFPRSQPVDENEPEPEASLPLSHEFSMTGSPSCFQEVMAQEMDATKKKLSKCIWKYPSGGATIFNSGSKRYFAVKTVSSAERINRHERVKLERTCLCYWEDEASRHEDPLASIPIASIRGVVKMEDAVLGVKALVAKKEAGETVLTLKFSSAKEADEWSNDLKHYVRWIRKREASQSKSPTRQHNASPTKREDLSPERRRR